jgi:hypothetical protein
MTLEDTFAVRPHLPLMTDRDLAGVARAIDRRRLYEFHLCAFCGARARAPLAAGASELLGPARWFDLCPDCNREIRIMLDELGRFALDTTELDAEIALRYEEWAASRAEAS